MKHRAKQQKLDRRISNFNSDSTIQRALGNHPGSYHKPGSLKK